MKCITRNSTHLKPSANDWWQPAAAGLLAWLAATSSFAGETSFHHAPTSTTKVENPYSGQATAADAGRQLFATHCAACHGRTGEGTGNIPALAHGPAQRATDGEIFWFITKGSNSGAMPSWASLPEQQRWQIITYLKKLPTEAAPVSAPTAAATPPVAAPPPR
ncbi:MAG TPA: cytochrome c [Rhodanobacter sp.]